MAWNFFSIVFGVICVVGPLLLIVWYFRAMREQVRKLNEK